MDHNMNFIQALELSVVAIVIVLAILVLIFIILNLFRFLPQEQKVTSTPLVYNTNDVVSNNVSQDNDEEERVVAMLMASIKGQQDCGKDVVIKSIERIK
jgi:septal ring-binding cell division protein DamX